MSPGLVSVHSSIKPYSEVITGSSYRSPRTSLQDGSSIAATPDITISFSLFIWHYSVAGISPVWNTIVSPPITVGTENVKVGFSFSGSIAPSREQS